MTTAEFQSPESDMLWVPASMQVLEVQVEKEHPLEPKVTVFRLPKPETITKNGVILLPHEEIYRHDDFRINITGIAGNKEPAVGGGDVFVVYVIDSPDYVVVGVNGEDGISAHNPELWQSFINTNQDAIAALEGKNEGQLSFKKPDITHRDLAYLFYESSHFTLFLEIVDISIKQALATDLESRRTLEYLLGLERTLHLLNKGFIGFRGLHRQENVGQFFGESGLKDNLLINGVVSHSLSLFDKKKQAFVSASLASFADSHLALRERFHYHWEEDLIYTDHSGYPPLQYQLMAGHDANYPVDKLIAFAREIDPNVGQRLQERAHEFKPDLYGVIPLTQYELDSALTKFYPYCTYEYSPNFSGLDLHFCTDGAVFPKERGLRNPHDARKRFMKNMRVLDFSGAKQLLANFEHGYTDDFIHTRTTIKTRPI